MDKTVKILILEDDPCDVELLLIELRKHFNIVSEWVHKEKEFNSALVSFSPDIITSDYYLPGFSGTAALGIRMELAPETPMIFVSGMIGEERAVELIKNGATDYVPKDKLYTLAPKVIRALNEANDRRLKKLAEEQLEKSEEKYRNMFKRSPIPMWVYEIETLRILNVNDAAIRHYGYSREEFLQMTIRDIRASGSEDELNRISVANSKGVYYSGKSFHLKKNREKILVEIQSSSIDFDGINGRLVLATDVTEKVKHMEAIEKQNEMLREISWIQSHVVRAPLARIMGLVDLLSGHKAPDEDELLGYIRTSAGELDQIIHSIVKKTQTVELMSSRDRKRVRR